MFMVRKREQTFAEPHYVPGLVLDAQSHFITTLRRRPCFHSSDEVTVILVCLVFPICCLRSTEVLALLESPRMKALGVLDEGSWGDVRGGSGQGRNLALIKQASSQ